MSKPGFTKWPKIFLFGDSITQTAYSKFTGWGSLISDHYHRRCDVVARGFSGYNTRLCKHVLPKVLNEREAEDIVALTIFLGANDAAKAGLREAQHVPLEEYKTNLQWMVDYCVSMGVSREKIILITPPALELVAHAKDCEKRGKVLARDVETSAKYSKACLEAASDIGVTCIDLYGEMMKSEDYSKYLADGLHLGVEGCNLLFQLLCPELEKRASHLQLIFPDYKDIDLKNVESAFKDW